MSTRQSYDYLLQEGDQQRLAAELRQRELELARLRAEEAVANHRAALTRCEAQTTELRRELDTAAMKLAEARSELDRQISTASALAAQIDCEADMLRLALARGQAALRQVEDTASATAKQADLLRSAAARGEEAAEAVRERESRLQQLEREIRFITQQGALQPAALVTLIAMQANGYQLRQVTTQEGLLSYFEQAITGHQITVRVAEVCRTGENVRRWELLAETFKMVGETCLEELDHFETAVDGTEIGRLERGQFRVYPKDEKGPGQEHRSVLPAPQKQPAQRRKDKQQDTCG